jgi:tetratricopeptide (TPR) repeat protein
MSERERPERLERGAMLALVVVAVGIAVVVFGAGSWAGTYFSNVRVPTIALGAVVSVAWLLDACRRPENRPASHLTLAFAAALGAFAVSAEFAPNPRLAVDFLGYGVLLTAGYVLLVRIWQTPGVAVRLTILLAILGALTGIAFLVAILATWLAFWTQLGSFLVPPLRLTYEGLWLGSPNALAAFQVLIFVAAAPGLLRFGRRGVLATRTLCVLLVVEVFLTASRGAWLGSALALAATGAAWLVTPAGRATIARVRAMRRARGPILLGAIVAAVIAVVLAPSLLARLTDFSGAGVRTSFFAASARMGEAAPLTGLGPGSWVPNRLAFTDATELDYYIPHAHNVPAQVVAEFGLVGVVAGIIVVGVVLRLVVAAIRHPSGLVRTSGLAALFACVFLSGQQLVDAFIHQPAILVAFAFPIARLDAILGPVEDARRTTPAARYRRLVLTATLLVAVLVGTGAALWPETAAQAHERAVDAADGGRWSVAAAEAAAAVEMDPGLAPYQFLRGIAAAETGDLRTARDALVTAAALDDLPAAWLDLAAVQVKLGDTGAADSLDRATRLGRQQPQIAVAAADLYRQLGHADRAAELLTGAFGALPSLTGDPAWADPTWTSIANEAIDNNLASTDRWTALLVALESGRTDETRAIADSLAPASHDLGRLVTDAWLGDQAAFRALHERATADPLDATTVGLCLRIARLHDPDGKSPGWTCDGGWWFGVYPIARLGAAPDAGAIPGPAAYPHALYAYRRPGPKDQLLTWLLHVHATPA